jgi:hypothetical protein
MLLESVTEMSIADLIKAALIDELPALQVVRPATPTRQGAVFILLLDAKAIKYMGPALKDFALQYGDPSRNKSLEIKTSLPVESVFTWLRDNKQKWSWGQLALSQPKEFAILACAYTGNRVCAKIAQFLALNGVRTVTA